MSFSLNSKQHIYFMAVVTTSKYSKQNTIILKKRNILFLLMKRKLSKGEKKKRISHEDRSWWDVWSFLFWRGEGRKRIEERKQKKQPQDNKLCMKQKIIPFEGHFLWVAASGRSEAEIKHWRESPHLLARHHSAPKCSGSRDSSRSSWGCADPSKQFASNCALFHQPTGQGLSDAMQKLVRGGMREKPESLGALPLRNKYSF